MKKKVIIAGKMLPEAFALLDNNFETISPTESDYFTSEQIIELLPDADALLSMFSAPKIDKAIIDKAGSRLKIIANFGVGYDNVDVLYAKQRGIAVTNTPDPVIEPTAELAMGLMIDAARKISFCNRELKNKRDGYKWGILENMGIGLYGKKLGIIGLGRIGKSLAKRATAFGMKVYYNNRNRLSDNIENNYNASYMPIDELISQCDIISLNAPANSSTYHIISERELQMMKRTAIIVNTARGTLIDEHALVKALKEGVIAAAALDVYERGDAKISEELYDMDNVTILPHIGTQTIDTRLEMARYACENIVRYFEGRELLSQVNK